MIFYQRNINGKLFALRSFSFVAGILCFFSFNSGYSNLGYFLSVVLVFLCLIVIEDLVVFQDSFQVKKFYFFGTVPIIRSFNINEKIFLHSNTAGYEEEDDGDGFSNFETAAGCLFYIYTVFGKKPRVTHRKFTIKKEVGAPGLGSSAEIFLSKEEYQLIKEIIDR